MEARAYLYDLYYRFPNYGLGKVLNSHDVNLVAFRNFTKCQFPPPLHSNLKIASWISPSLRDGPLENLRGVGGEVQKQIFAQGKIKWKKIHACQLTLKNIRAAA